MNSCFFLVCLVKNTVWKEHPADLERNEVLCLAVLCYSFQPCPCQTAGLVGWLSVCEDHSEVIFLRTWWSTRKKQFWQKFQSQILLFILPVILHKPCSFFMLFTCQRSIIAETFSCEVWDWEVLCSIPDWYRFFTCWAGARLFWAAEHLCSQDSIALVLLSSPRCSGIDISEGIISLKIWVLVASSPNQNIVLIFKHV